MTREEVLDRIDNIATEIYIYGSCELDVNDLEFLLMIVNNLKEEDDFNVFSC